MLGAICGDIIGSIYESWYFQDTVKDLNFEIFTSASIFTDDTVLSVAIADAILTKQPYEQKLVEWFGKYPNRGYGGGFVTWANEFSKYPKNRNTSNGNGCCMRVSPIGFAFNDLHTVQLEAIKSSEYTHNTPEAAKGAQAVASAVFLANRGKSKQEIKNYIESTFGYNLNHDVEYVRNNFDHRTTRCDVAVPQALICFLQGTDYENTIRLAIYSKGDCDTIAAIAGSIAYAFYKEIPNNILMFAFSKIPQDMRYIASTFHDLYNIKK
jgi:ADP-ribosylglycohydrolase